MKLKKIYEFNNGSLKNITMDDVIYFSEHDVTGDEYKENKYILSNFCLNNNKCYSKQYGGMLTRGLVVDFDNPMIILSIMN